MHKSRSVDQSVSLPSFVEHAVRARMSTSHTILQPLSASAKQVCVWHVRLHALTTFQCTCVSGTSQEVVVCQNRCGHMFGSGACRKVFAHLHSVKPSDGQFFLTHIEKRRKHAFLKRILKRSSRNMRNSISQMIVYPKDSRTSQLVWQ